MDFDSVLRTIAFNSSAIVCCDRFCSKSVHPRLCCEASQVLLATALLLMGVDHVALSHPAAMEGQIIMGRRPHTAVTLASRLEPVRISAASVVSSTVPVLIRSISQYRCSSQSAIRRLHGISVPPFFIISNPYRCKSAVRCSQLKSTICVESIFGKLQIRDRMSTNANIAYNSMCQ